MIHSIGKENQHCIIVHYYIQIQTTLLHYIVLHIKLKVWPTYYGNPQ